MRTTKEQKVRVIINDGRLHQIMRFGAELTLSVIMTDGFYSGWSIVSPHNGKTYREQEICGIVGHKALGQLFERI